VSVVYYQQQFWYLISINNSVDFVYFILRKTK